MSYIDKEAFIESQRHLYCENCDYRKGMKNGKLRFCYEIGGAACKACGINDMLNDIEDYPAADVIDEENVLKFYYVRSTDDYWIGQRVGNFYYAEFDPEALRWTWTHSRYLPWGEHVVSPTSLWKEHTYPSKPEEMPFEEWLRGLIKKYFPAADVRPVVRGEWNAVKGALHPAETSAVCSNCGFATMIHAQTFYNFCPNCGADMRNANN